MTEELFDVVDEQDRVIGQAQRSVVHERGLLHRAVHIFVFNQAGQLLIQLRSARKDEFPNCYTSSASGHLDAGESYAAAASRELNEELGMQLSLEFVAKFAAGPELANEHTALYRAVADGIPAFDRSEIDDVSYRDLDAIADVIDREPERFASPFRFLFDWYTANVDTTRPS